MKVTLELLDTCVDLQVEDPQMYEMVCRLWDPFVVDPSGLPEHSFAVLNDADGWVIRGRDYESRHEEMWNLLDALRYQLLEVVESGLKRFVTIHAAAVAKADGGVLLVGESGTGKTTLALDLTRAGWLYVTDDLAPISLSDGTIHPFPKPLGVKDAHDSLGSRAEVGSKVAASGYLMAPPRARTTAPVRARLLLFPRFAADALPSVEEMTPAEAAATGARFVRRRDATSLRALRVLCSDSACYRVVHSGGAEAVAQIEELYRLSG